MRSKLLILLAILLIPAVSRSGELIDRVVATVGKDVITLSELIEFNAQFSDLSKEDALEALIDDILVEQEARRVGIEISDAEVEANIQTRMAQLSVSETEFNALLAEQGLTPQAYRERVRAKIMKFKFVQGQMRGGIDISDEDVLNYYRTHPDEFVVESEIRIAYLFLPFPLSGDVAQMDKIRTLANELRARIEKGEDFAALVKQYSKGPAIEDGGDMGWVNIEDLNFNFRAALTQTTVGFVTDAFETDNGMNILKVTEVKNAQTVPFDQVKDAIFQRIYEIKIQDEMTRMVREIKQRTPIERKL